MAARHRDRNKQLLSHHGEELGEAARVQGVQLRFEGAVAGVIPVVRVHQGSLAGATISSVHGIVNGTTNFIFTESLTIVSDVVSAFYRHLEVADEPGVLANIAQVLAHQNVSVKSVVQRA